MFLKMIRLRSIALAVITGFSLSLMPVAPASAALIGNDSVAAEQTRMDDRQVVKEFMDREDVRSQFESLGVDPDEAKSRVDALSDAEAAKLADDIESAPAGGLIGALVGAAVLVFLVLLITDLLGFTHVFGFTNKGAANPS